MIVFHIAWLTLLAGWLLFVFYAAVMNLKRARDAGQINTFGKVLGYPALYVGLLLDVLVNTTLMTVLFAELPREWLVTLRLARHAQGSGWRQRVALVFRPLLNPLDPSGRHF